MEESNLRSVRRLLVLILVVQNLSAKAESIAGKAQMATDIANDSLFLDNPATVFPSRVWISYLRLQHNRKTDVVEADDQTTQSYDAKDLDQALAAVIPMGGGSAVGLTGEFASLDISANNEQSTAQEKFRTRAGSARFIADMTNSLRLGFAYNYKEVQASIGGNFGVGADDRTGYRAGMGGYSVGFFFEGHDSGFGMGYQAPMRGKAEVEGEEKIFSEPGTICADAYYSKPNKTSFGLAMQRHVYKHDDRRIPSTSPENQRRISLNGTDFDQFYYPVQTILAGFDYPIETNVLIRLSLTLEKSVFLFNGDEIPGGNEREESTASGRGLTIAGRYDTSEFKAEVGISELRREAGSISDTRGWFGSGRYEDYESKVRNFFILFSFVN